MGWSYDSFGNRTGQALSGTPPAPAPQPWSVCLHFRTEAAMEPSTEKSIWIGMVQVLSLPGSEILQGVSGAYVNILTWAANPSEFREKAKELMDYLGVKLVGVEDEEPLSKREERGEVDADVAQVALEVKGNPKSIRYMTFHTWTEVDA